MPSSTGFRLLDAHVVAGRGEEPALIDGGTSTTFAELLHEAAVIAGAWRLLGLDAGDPISLEVAGRDRVLAVLAAVRLQLVPGDGPARLAGEPPVTYVGDEEVAWGDLRQLGRTAPLPAAVDDEPHVAAWHDSHADVLEPLLAGSAVSL